MKNYKIRIDIQRADNGWYMQAIIGGDKYQEVFKDKESLYERLDAFRDAVDEIEEAG